MKNPDKQFHSSSGKLTAPCFKSQAVFQNGDGEKTGAERGSGGRCSEDANFEVYGKATRRLREALNSLVLGEQAFAGEWYTIVVR